METSRLQAMIGHPGKKRAEEKKEGQGDDGEKQIGEGAALEQKAPIHGLVPTRENVVEKLAQMEALEGQGRYTDVGRAFVRVLRWVAGNQAGGLAKEVGVLEFAES